MVEVVVEVMKGDVMNEGDQLYRIFSVSVVCWMDELFTRFSAVKVQKAQSGQVRSDQVRSQVW